MTKKMVVLSLAVTATALILLSMTVVAAEQAKAGKEKAAITGEQVNITGRLSCVFCTLAHPGMACTPDCCTNCVKAGDPPLLTDADGNMYILVTSEKDVALMTPERVKMMGGQIAVKGTLVKGKGVQAIYVDSMEKVEAKTSTKMKEKQ